MLHSSSGTGMGANPSGHHHHDPVSRLIFELAKLPGIGEKTATRLAYYILRQDSSYAHGLADALQQAKQKVGLCQSCYTFSDGDFCMICQDPQRTRSIICVVEKPTDILSIEQSGQHRGLYHVLHGALSPLDGVGPDDLRIHELLDRVSQNAGQPIAIQEVILATNPSVEGESTALYISKLLKPFQIKVTQLAYGIPVGGLLEYTDRQTIGRAMTNRVEIL